MDMTAHIAPKSDQINADDLIAGPMTITVKDVQEGNAEQRVNVYTEETPGRAYRPSLSMIRVMVKIWGKDSTQYVGRRLTLYRNDKIRFGKDEVGGIEISHMSGITEAVKVVLTASRGKKKPFTVQPLADPAPYTPSRDFLTEIKDAPDADTKNAVWQAAVADGATTEYLDKLKRAGS